MLTLLRKAFGLRYRFSNYDSFKAGERIFKTIYEHDEHIKEDFEGKTSSQIATMITQNQGRHRTLLSDQIRENLTQMKSQNEIGSKVANELLDAFDPVKGIKLNEVPFYRMHADRFRDAVNASILFPLKPNSSVIKFFLKQIFQKIDGLFTIRYSGTLIYVKGTSGLGKSSCLFIAKYILDQRIKYLIQTKAHPSDSIFDKDQNYKLLCFHAQASTRSIQAEILRNIQTDFGTECPAIQAIKKEEKLQNKFYILNEIYEKSNIKIISIIDQLNSIYKTRQIQKAKQEKYDAWKQLNDICEGFLIVSSKNNTQIRNQQEIVSLISDPNKNFVTFNMDNYISPEARLAYSIECLLFELEKNGMQRAKAVEFLKDIKDVPLISHLAVRQAIKKVKVQLKEFLKENSQENRRKIVTNLKSSLLDIQKIDFNKYFLVNFSQLSSVRVQNLLNLLASLDFLKKQININEINSKLVINLPDSKKTDITKSIEVVSKQQSNQNKLMKISEAVYFFEGYRLSKTLEGKKQVFTSLEVNKLNKLVSSIYSKQNFPKINQLIKLYPQLSLEFARNIRGTFQNIVCANFDEHIQNRRENSKLYMNLFINQPNTPKFRRFYFYELFFDKVSFKNNILEQIQQVQDYQKKISSQNIKESEDEQCYLLRIIMRNKISLLNICQGNTWYNAIKVLADIGKQSLHLQNLVHRLEKIKQLTQRIRPEIQKGLTTEDEQKMKNLSSFYSLMRKVQSLQNFKHKILLEIIHQMTKQKKEKQNYYLRQTSFFLRPQIGNPAYDFLLSNYQEKTLEIFLVDTTLETDPKKLSQKVNKFYKLFQDNICFQLLIEECNRSAKVEAINIQFFILQAHRGFYENQDLFQTQFAKSVHQIQQKHKTSIQTFKSKLEKVRTIQVSRGHYSQEFQLQVRDEENKPYDSIFNPVLNLNKTKKTEKFVNPNTLWL